MNVGSTLDMDLLDRLRRADGFVAIERLGEDAAASLRALRALEQFGFRLEWHPYRGVAYAGPAERLCPDQIEHWLNTVRIGRRVAVWDRVASTNELAVRASGTAANEGLVVLAEQQTAGRGRRGRTWSSPARKSILMSVVLRPPADLGDVAWLTALGAVAAAQVIEGCGLRLVRIKWPNDVYVGDRKIAGVLAERRGAGVALGIGLNVNLGIEDIDEELRGKATSIRIETARSHDRSALARELIAILDHHYVRAIEGGPGVLNEPWRARLGPLGTLVRLMTATGEVAGRLIDADLSRGLVLQTGDGPLFRLRLGEILSFDVESISEAV